jgi:DDE family transposase
MHVYSPTAYTIPGVDSMPAALTPPLHLAPLHLAPVGAKAVDLDFDGGRLSSEAGLVLRKDPAEPLGLTHNLAAGLSDPRDPRRVHLTHRDLLKQRVWHSAAGDEDANDANTLRHDPLFKLLRDRLPETGAPLAAPPTLSRFENRVSRTELSRMALVLVDQFLAASVRPPTRIVLDCDDTEAPVQGGPAQARYDGSDGGDCFLPLPLYEGLSGRLMTTIFQAKRLTGAQRLAVLTRLVKRLRQAWPHTLLLLRGDSHFAYPEGMPWSEEQPALSDVTGLTSNRVLPELAREIVAQAKRAYGRDGGKRTRFHSTRYQAGTWSRSRRVVIQVEVSAQGGNTRCVVTDMEYARPQGLYQHIYCARGQAENEIKDHKRSLKSDRTSWHRFEANQCRLFLHAAAYVLLDTWRREVCKTTPWAAATMETIQLRLRKLGARVQECTDRIKISLPSSCPVAPVLRRSLTWLACVRLA